MKRKKVRQKAHAPTRRTPRYPVSTKPTGRGRRVQKRKWKVHPEHTTTAEGLYIRRIERGGECPDWLIITATNVPSPQNVVVNNLTADDSVIILERCRTTGREFSYRTEQYETVTDTYFVVMPLSHAYWRMQAVEHMFRISSSRWYTLRSGEGAYGYTIVLPEAGVAITKYLEYAHQARAQMLKQIAALS